MSHRVFITADTHFGHKFMAELRGYTNRAEHDEMLTSFWNRDVSPTDEVYILGDFSFQPKEEAERQFAKLNGRKHLIVGNHDPNRVQKLGWETVNQMLSRKFCGHSYFMCHYPMLTWPNAHKGVRHLHGHSHGNLDNPTKTTRLDVGWDCIGIRTVEEVDAMFEGLIYDKVDHHY